ncbi:DegT/DnrJ/EryC1/StrS family aminotransferase [Compostibacter hankyongensis]|uniref:DegT/DnrJ/EryC1/StrS family aminotransferase n=1 Tax=Compostibacter hankyongensis TaxID=1007089 RepID=A0ABP8GBK3_9BACT
MERSIQMVDLKAQYYKLKEEIDNALISVAEGTAYINGPQVKDFAKDLKQYNKVKHVIPCGNGTDALQIAMMALNFKPGDEVIVPAFTYIATVEVIALLGLTPKFIDVREDTFEIDYDQLGNVISEKTVGIVPVHLFGQCSNMEVLLKISKKYNIAIIEDTAQAIGAEFIFKDGTRKFAGTIGDIGTTSFFPSKNLGCYGDGGALFTNDEQLSEKAYMIANHGQREKYHHETIGVNSRLDTLQAAILQIKLRHLNNYSRARQNVADRYDERLKGHSEIIIPFRAPYSTHVFNQYTCRIKSDNRKALKQYLTSKGIPSMIYYPIPLHLQEAYRTYGYKAGDFPVAERLCEEVISLPIHTEMKHEDQDYIIEEILNYFKTAK